MGDAYAVIKKANQLGYNNTEIRAITPDAGFFSKSNSFSVYISRDRLSVKEDAANSAYRLVSFIIDMLDEYVVSIGSCGATLIIKVNDIDIASLLSSILERYLSNVNSITDLSFQTTIEPSGINNYSVSLSFDLSKLELFISISP